MSRKYCRKSLLIDWCFTPLSTVFQSYHGNSSHYSYLTWVSPVLGWALKCLAQGHSHEKPQSIQCCSNLGPLDYESNTLPLSHVAPCRKRRTCWLPASSPFATMFSKAFLLGSLKLCVVYGQMSRFNPFSNDKS